MSQRKGKLRRSHPESHLTDGLIQSMDILNQVKSSFTRAGTQAAKETTAELGSGPAEKPIALLLSFRPSTVSFGMGSPLTTHALDTSTGRPAAGLRLELYRQKDDGSEECLKSATCNDNGRVSDLIDPVVWKTAVYRIRFFTEEYFATTKTECFYPHCDITFFVRDTDSHHHVPLLLSPFGFSTYRGS